MKVNYQFLKHFCIAIQTFSVPISVYSGIMLATGKPELFTIGIIISMGLTFFQAELWWKVMEKLKE
jgi:hypothetical protein